MSTPRLGIIYDPGTVDLLPLVRAGTGTWRSVWLVDTGRLPAGSNLRVFERFGELVDITGRTPAEVAVLLAEPLDGLLATNDADLVLGSQLAPALGVPFATAEQALRLTDKRVQRAALRAAGLPSPASVAFAAGTAVADAVGAAAAITCPAVLKPAHGSGSRGTSSVADASMLAARLAEHGDPLGEALVLEERIPDGWERDERPWADIVSVESIVSGRAVHHLGLTGRFALLPEFRETGNFVPAAVPPSEWDGLGELAGAAIRSLDGPDGAYHTELKLSSDGPRVLEVNGRLGGGSLVWGTELVTGVSLLELAGRAALGLPLDEPGGLDPSRFTGVAFGRYVQPPLDAGCVTALDGVEEVHALSGVQEVIVFSQPGSPVDPSAGFLAHVCAVRGRVPDHEQMADLVARIDATVRVTYS